MKQIKDDCTDNFRTRAMRLQELEALDAPTTDYAFGLPAGTISRWRDEQDMSDGPLLRVA